MTNVENLKTDKKNVLKTTLHADELLTSHNVVGLQTAKLEDDFLLDIPNSIVSNIKSSNKKGKLNDTMFDLVLDYSEQTKENGNTRTLKKTGSIFTSILIAVITITIGLITAIILTK